MLSVGDGSRILITQDSWLSNAESSFISSDLDAAYDKVTKKELMIPGEKQ